MSLLATGRGSRRGRFPGLRFRLQQRGGEPNDDRGALAGGAVHIEAAATHLRALAHHRHSEVALGTGCGGVEPDAVVTELQLDLLTGLSHHDPQVGGLRVLEGVHDALAGDVIDEQGDRGRQRDLLHVGVEHDAGIAALFLDERLEGLAKSLGSQRTSVEVADERTDPVGGLLLRLPDLLELLEGVVQLTLLQ